MTKSDSHDLRSSHWMKMHVVQASQPAAARMAAPQEMRPEFSGQNDPAVAGTIRRAPLFVIQYAPRVTPS
jgi:hypothetical protein